MLRDEKPHILIVEDDIDLAEMLTAYFSVQGYEVHMTGWGTEAIDIAGEVLPDLVILDIYLPDIDGFEVVTRLRDSHKTRHLPIIFLTMRDQRIDRLHGLELEVVDYITKPFDIQELRLRVRNILRRVESLSMENPVTGLPEGPPVDDVLEEIRMGGDDYSLLVTALKGLDTFRELYGFVASDDVLRVASLTINSAAHEVGGEGAFCGHLDDHTFALVLPQDRVGALVERIRQRLSGSMEYFYPGDNRGPNATTSDRLRLLTTPIDLDGLSFSTREELVIYINRELIHQDAAAPQD